MTSKAETAGKTLTHWSQRVSETSFALDFEAGVFTWHDSRRIALSLKRSAESSMRRKSSPFRSAMSMLNFYINRAGNKLTAEQRAILEQARRSCAPSMESAPIDGGVHHWFAASRWRGLRAKRPLRGYTRMDVNLSCGQVVPM